MCRQSSGSIIVLFTSILEPRMLYWWLLLFSLAVQANWDQNNSDKAVLGTDEDTPDQDYFELIKYAHLSSVAYCAPLGLETGTIGSQGDKCPSPSCSHEHIKDIDIVTRFNFDNFLDVGNGFIALDPEEDFIYVVVKGTSSSTDWINNLDLVNTEYQPQAILDPRYDVSGICCTDCRVHRGFASFIKTNGYEVIKMILEQKKKYPHREIKIAGHSLGAALGLLIGIELRLLGYEALVVTLGSPKIGNPQFTKFVDDLFETDNVVQHIEEYKSFETLTSGYIRMIHKHDLIPFLPPTNKYTLAGYEYYLGVEGLHQTPMTVYRRATDYLEDKKFDYWDTIKNFRRIDHSSYFLPVTTCVLG